MISGMSSAPKPPVRFGIPNIKNKHSNVYDIMHHAMIDGF